MNLNELTIYASVIVISV